MGNQEFVYYYCMRKSLPIPCYFLLVFLLTGLLSAKVALASKPINLPTLGDASSAIISKGEEHRMGQGFLRALYGQVPMSQDPIIYNYLNELTNKLVINSPLSPKHYYLVVIDNNSFNAFAAPGNIMGINLGLFLSADTEDELASVIAHEIGHLTQRHYARQLERQKSQRYVSLASLLGGLLIMASGQADAGLATVTAGQAIAIDQQLKYSRRDEQEADRIGIATLYQTGFNPKAAAGMFQHLQTQMRYREDIKQFDFLLTHPLTESRISDAHNQANLYPAQIDQDSFDFHLMKARAELAAFKNSRLAATHFQQSASKHPKALRYGLALAYLTEKKPLLAKPIIDKLYDESPHKIPFIIAKAEYLLALKQPETAIKLLRKQLRISPNNYPLSLTLVNAYQQNQQMQAAAELLSSFIKGQSHTPAYLWYQLAEIQGLAGNIGEVHRARGEYFITVGALKDAQRHLKLALPFFKSNRQISAKIKTRIEVIKALEKEKKGNR